MRPSQSITLLLIAVLLTGCQSIQWAESPIPVLSKPAHNAP